ncbi:MAG TPA: sigma 54-interacting transcriptional regulator [Kofleriaceae bacterium]|nr:sigma 54-interacting transcriptional regulator [Kofleriaceae bacterium]
MSSGGDIETRAGGRQAPPSGLQLVIMAEAGSRRIDLPKAGTVTLGRGDTVDVKIDDASISRQHAAVHVGQTLQIEDLGSSNGTYLHGARLDANRRVDLSAGEFFEVGSVVCVVRGLSAHDRLRQLRTHDYFEARLQDEAARAERGRSHPAVVRVRIDADADEDQAAADLLAAVQPGDVVARYAPGEYEVLVIDSEGPAVAELVADLGRRVPGAAVGAALHPRDGLSAEELFSAACRAVDPEQAGDGAAGELIVESPAMRRLHELLARVAAGGVNVLLLGETGVGKEVFATRLHALSPRAAGPLVKLNCAAFTDTLLESELFGHERGAFTGADRRKVGLLEAADRGMVFLDEVGEMAAGIQAKLLRVLEDRKLRRVGGTEEVAIDVVFIGATNRDLAAEVAAGRFRADLYYRLNGFALTIPPLRERREEIVPLARQFAAAAARRMNLPAPPALADEVLPLLAGHRWSGNIRELKNTMDRAVLLSGGGVIQAEHLPVDNLRAQADPLEQGLARAAAGETPPGLTADELAERARIIEVLAAEVGNQTRAAEVLGISRRWLTTLMARYRIPRPRKR